MSQTKILNASNAKCQINDRTFITKLQNISNTTKHDSLNFSFAVSLGDFLPKAREAIPNFLGAKFTSIDVRDLLKCHRLKQKFKLISGFEDVSNLKLK